MNALLLLDFQNDFSPFGALAVPTAPAVVAQANAWLADPRFERRIATQNWHPAQQLRFAANHYFRYPGQVVDLKEEAQGLRLWPLYGIADSFGAELMPELDATGLDAVVRKGQSVDTPSHSALEASATPALLPLLEGVTNLYVGGFFLEYSLLETVLDLLEGLPALTLHVVRGLTVAKDWETGDAAGTWARLTGLERIMIVD